MAEPNTNVFVSDLPADIDDEKLAAVFGQYGTVTWSKLMVSKGKPMNAAIVEFSTVDEAKWVVESLNGNLAQGIETPISVMFKRERGKGGKGKGKSEDGKGKKGNSWSSGGKDSSKGGGGWGAQSNVGGGWGAKNQGNAPQAGVVVAPEAAAAAAVPNTNVFISDLPADIDDEKLAAIFGQYGTVTWSKVMTSKGKPTNAAIVEFGDIEEAKWVVENLNGNLAQGIATPINVCFKREKGKGKGKDKGGYGKSQGGWGKGKKGSSPY